VLNAHHLFRVSYGSAALGSRTVVEALRKWNPSELPKWLDEDFYRMEILPRLAEFTAKKIRMAIDVSHPYATLIKRGSKIPHPRHWRTLADLVGISDKLTPVKN
jgi:hypothetical protein